MHDFLYLLIPVLCSDRGGPECLSIFCDACDVASLSLFQSMNVAQYEN